MRGKFHSHRFTGPITRKLYAKEKIFRIYTKGCCVAWEITFEPMKVQTIGYQTLTCSLLFPTCTLSRRPFRKRRRSQVHNKEQHSFYFKFFVHHSCFTLYMSWFYIGVMASYNRWPVPLTVSVYNQLRQYASCSPSNRVYC